MDCLNEKNYWEKQKSFDLNNSSSVLIIRKKPLYFWVAFFDLDCFSNFSIFSSSLFTLLKVWYNRSKSLFNLFSCLSNISLDVSSALSILFVYLIIHITNIIMITISMFFHNHDISCHKRPITINITHSTLSQFTTPNNSKISGTQTTIQQIHKITFNVFHMIIYYDLKLN